MVQEGVGARHQKQYYWEEEDLSFFLMHCENKSGAVGNKVNSWGPSDPVRGASHIFVSVPSFQACVVSPSEHMQLSVPLTALCLCLTNNFLIDRNRSIDTKADSGQQFYQFIYTKWFDIFFNFNLDISRFFSTLSLFSICKIKKIKINYFLEIDISLI